MTQDQHKLEPCPMCGCTAILVKQRRTTIIECSDCGLALFDHQDGVRRDVFAAWNRRAHLQQRPLPVSEGTPLTIDQQFWLDKRGAIVEALESYGLQIWSDKDRVWLHSIPGVAWVGQGLKPPDAPSLPVREEPTPLQPPEFQEATWGVDSVMRPVKSMAISEYRFRLWCEANGIALASPSVQNMGEGETGKDGVDVPRAADPLEGAPEVCEGCGAIEARNESHHHACPRGTEASARKRLNAVPAHLRGLVQLQGHDEHPEPASKDGVEASELPSDTIEGTKVTLLADVVLDAPKDGVKGRTLYDQRTAIDDACRDAAPQLYAALRNLLDAVRERRDNCGIESVVIADATAALATAGVGGTDGR